MVTWLDYNNSSHWHVQVSLTMLLLMPADLCLQVFFAALIDRTRSFIVCWSAHKRSTTSYMNGRLDQTELERWLRVGREIWHSLTSAFSKSTNTTAKRVSLNLTTSFLQGSWVTQKTSGNFWLKYYMQILDILKQHNAWIWKLCFISWCFICDVFYLCVCCVQSTHSGRYATRSGRRHSLQVLSIADQCPHTIWKVLDFFYKISRTWKVLEIIV